MFFLNHIVMKTIASGLRGSTPLAKSRGRKFKQWLIGGGVVLSVLEASPARGQLACDLSAIDPVESGVQRAGSVCNGNLPANSSVDYQTMYSQMSYWIPDATTPIKIIPVAVHVFQPTGGSPAFLDIPAHHAIIQQQLDWVNGWYANNCAPSDPIAGVPFIADTKIWFEVGNRMYFYVDDALSTSCSATLFRQKVIDTDPTRLEALAIYYTTGSCTQNATPPSPSWMSAWPYPNANFDYDQRVVQSVTPAGANSPRLKRSPTNWVIVWIYSTHMNRVAVMKRATLLSRTMCLMSLARVHHLSVGMTVVGVAMLTSSGTPVPIT